MAPVGSRESLAAAFQAGADSVYFGVGRLNMRSRSSDNFGIEDLHELAELCRERGVKSYLTVNSVLYQEDLPDMRYLVDEAKKAGVSAIIAADVAAMVYARSIGMEVHLSTQLNTSDDPAFARLPMWSLAGELNLDQVSGIYASILERNLCGPSGKPVRIEMFCHGALCMAISGKCYLSLHEYNASANRGACYQLCRRGYTVKDKETDVELDIDNQYIMSPKDLKTIHFMNKMLDAGVRVFKIEGRARGGIRQDHGWLLPGGHRYLFDNTFTQKRGRLVERLARCSSRVLNRYYLGQHLGNGPHECGSSTREGIDRKVSSTFPN